MMSKPNRSDNKTQIGTTAFKFCEIKKIFMSGHKLKIGLNF